MRSKFTHIWQQSHFNSLFYLVNMKQDSESNSDSDDDWEICSVGKVQEPAPAEDWEDDSDEVVLEPVEITHGGIADQESKDPLLLIAQEIAKDFASISNHLLKVTSFRKFSDHLKCTLAECSDAEGKYKKVKQAWILATFRHFNDLLVAIFGPSSTSQQSNMYKQYKLNEERQNKIKEFFELLSEEEEQRRQMDPSIHETWFKVQCIKRMYNHVFISNLSQPRVEPPTAYKGRPICTTSSIVSTIPKSVDLENLCSDDYKYSTAFKACCAKIEDADAQSVAKILHGGSFKFKEQQEEQFRSSLRDCINKCDLNRSEGTIVTVLRWSQQNCATAFTKRSLGKFTNRSTDEYWRRLKESLQSNNLQNVMKQLISSPLQEVVARCYGKQLPLLSFVHSVLADSPKTVVERTRGEGEVSAGRIDRFLVSSVSARCLMTWQASHTDLISLQYLHHTAVHILLSSSNSLFNCAESYFDAFHDIVSSWISEHLGAFIAEHRQQREFLCYRVYLVLRYYVRQCRPDVNVNHLPEIRTLLSQFDQTERDLIFRYIRTNYYEFTQLLQYQTSLAVYFNATLPAFSTTNATTSMEDDLRNIANYSESSMRALSPSEERKLKALKDRYLPADPNATNDALSFLREYLAVRYEEAPAEVELHEVHIVLPLTWEAYEAEVLPRALSIIEEVLRNRGQVVAAAAGEDNDDDDTEDCYFVEQEMEKFRDQVMKAYYRHVRHTAWRYLLPDNPWFARFDAFAAGHGRSSFAAHKEEIVVMFRAAADDRMPPPGEVSIQDRIDLVFREMALINRAHNYDNGEIDDLKGDSPSCRSGEVKRLMQSLLYYPYDALLLQVNVDAVRERIHGLLQAHWLKTFDRLSMNDQNRVKESWSKCIWQHDISDKQSLAVFAVTTELREEWIPLIQGHANIWLGDSAAAAGIGAHEQQQQQQQQQREWALGLLRPVVADVLPSGEFLCVDHAAYAEMFSRWFAISGDDA